MSCLLLLLLSSLLNHFQTLGFIFCITSLQALSDAWVEGIFNHCSGSSERLCLPWVIAVLSCCGRDVLGSSAATETLIQKWLLSADEQWFFCGVEVIFILMVS